MNNLTPTTTPLAIDETAITPPVTNPVVITFPVPTVPAVDEGKAFQTLRDLYKAQSRVSPADIPAWQTLYIALAPKDKIADIREIVTTETGGDSNLPCLTYTIESIKEELKLAGVREFYVDERLAFFAHCVKPQGEKLEAVIGNNWMGIVNYLVDSHRLTDLLRWNRTSEGLDVFKNGKWEPDRKAESYNLLRGMLLPRLIFRLGELKEKALAYIPKETDDKRKKNPVEALCDSMSSWILRLQSPQGMETLIQAIAQTPGLVISEEDYDASPYLLNLVNGVYDLKANLFIAAENISPSDRLCRHQITCSYDAKAKAPEWEKFCGKVFADSDATRYVQTYIGAGLSGEMIERCLILYGAGSNGKSTLLAMVSALVGGYATSFNIAALMGDSRGVNSEYEIRKLKGARMAFATESREGAKLDESILKKICSKDKVCARFPYELPIQFQPTHKTILATNHKPRVEAADKGTWRRLSMVSMSYDFDLDVEKKLDVEVEAIFQRELPGVLNWVIEGWRRYRSEGLLVPASIEADTREYRCEEDKLMEWISEQFEVTNKLADQVELSAVWTLYDGRLDWQKDIKSNRTLKKELQSRGFKVATGAGNKVYVHGIAPKG